VFNLIVTVEAFLITKSFWVLGPGGRHPRVGAISAACGSRGFFDIWITKLRTCPRGAQLRLLEGQFVPPMSKTFLTTGVAKVLAPREVAVGARPAL